MNTQSAWARNPKIYEINTWVWLSDLEQKYRKQVGLGSIPLAEWDAIAKHGFDAVWLMGVWERSPAGIAIANKNQALLEDFRRALPDFDLSDNVGSPYCVRGYVVDQHLGGPEGLAIARRELGKRGVKLILDFVPNHVAPDHPWVIEHAEYFVRGSTEDVTRDPASFIDVQGNVYACGRDPHFAAWPDVLQLNAFHPELRQATVETVSQIAGQCDGIRCDMAMLLMNTIFERTWESRVGKPSATEYWVDLISAVKQSHPDFLFIAEAYWELEWELQQQGFDFCYDKKLYDRLEHTNPESVRLHLCADPVFQEKLLRFIENHDEPRAATTFSDAKHRAAAVAMATVPGARLFHEGQLEGRKVRLPVFLGRRPHEPADYELQSFYATLLKIIDSPLFSEGQWNLCVLAGWPDNASYKEIVASTWRKDDDRYLIINNLSDRAVQARVQIPWTDMQKVTWRLKDVFSGVSFDRDGDEMLSSGLYVELGPWNCNFFQCSSGSIRNVLLQESESRPSVLSDLPVAAKFPRA